MHSVWRKRTSIIFVKISADRRLKMFWTADSSSGRRIAASPSEGALNQTPGGLLLLCPGLLEGHRESAARNCIDKLTILLQLATKERPLEPPSLLPSQGSSNLGGPHPSGGATPGENPEDNPQIRERAKYKAMFAEFLAKMLVKKGRDDLDDFDLHHLIYEMARTTFLDDGTLCPPPTERSLSPPPVHRYQEVGHRAQDVVLPGGVDR